MGRLSCCASFSSLHLSFNASKAVSSPNGTLKDSNSSRCLNTVEVLNSVIGSITPIPRRDDAVLTVLRNPSRLVAGDGRSEELTSELQSHHDLVCRLLLEK